MIIRAPTRTMTKSFNGKQMGAFKFPSIENEPAEPLDEYHLNNHHLLNDNVAVKSHQKTTTDEDGISQIQSDYTSVSNANTNSGNSSNGYYSFANISDNTTSMPSKTQSYTSSPHSIGSGDGGNKASELTVPRDEQHNNTSQKSLEPMEVIPEDNGNGYASVSLNVPSIMTADNFSFDIASSRSLKPRSTTKKVDSTTSLVNSPSLGSSRSSALSASVSNSSLGSPKIPQPKRRSQLKRSGSIRCRGGLLQYFAQLGTRIKRTLRKIRMALRRRNSKRSVSPKGAAISANAPKVANKPRVNVTRVSSKKELTSHLNRTNGYVSNLQRSVSQRSLRPLLEESKAIRNYPSKRPPPDGSANKFVTPPGSRIVHYPTTPLRRTPSSIRRAASVIRTPMPAGSPVAASSNGSICENALVGQVGGSDSGNTGVVRSSGSKSLNSLVRQRSIVVKNKVIPLSMHQYSIREEDEDKYRGSQFIIKSSSRYSLSPQVSSENNMSLENGGQSANSSLSGISLGDYTDAYEDVDPELNSFESEFSVEPSQSPVASFIPSANESTSYSTDSSESYESSESIDSSILGQEIQDFTNNINQYFKCVISQRIKLRLQLSQYEAVDPTSSSYLDLIESLLGDYESEPGASHPPGGNAVSIGTISEENLDLESDEVVPLFSDYERDAIRINVQSGYCRRGNSKRSTISLGSKDVKRSLTLPISLKV